MEPLSKTGRILLVSLFGGILGFLVLHPYTMLIYGIYHSPGDLFRAGSGVVLRQLASSFYTEHLSMGIPFVFFGAVAGLFSGFWLETRRQRIEAEKRLLALDTLRQLMMTLSHHLLNASQVVGGFAERDIRVVQDETIRRHLDAIRNEAVRIEAVVKSLQSLESIRIDRFQGDRHAAMVDIREELARNLEKLK